MSYEVVPFTPEQQAGLSVFEHSVISYFEEHGDQNVFHQNPYNPKKAPEGEIYESFGGDGRVDFASLWKVNRTYFPDIEFTVAHRPLTLFVSNPLFEILREASDDPEVAEPTKENNEPLKSQAKVLITEFGERGATARTTFTEYDGVLNKQRVVNFGAHPMNGVSVLSKEATLTEVEHLFDSLGRIEESEIAIRSLVALTEHERIEADEALEDHNRREEQYRRQLDAIARSQVIVPRFIGG